MIDPTQQNHDDHDEQNGNPSAPANKPAPGDEGAGPAAAPGREAGDETDRGPLKAQAYVDPSIAAEAQLAALEQENADLKDRFIRAHAEMDNLRKRTEREKSDTAKYAVTKFAGDVLAVADNLQRALAAFAQSGAEADPQTAALIKGVELTDVELAKVLDRHGVQKIEALGEIFDPNLHQAVQQAENKDVAAGTILMVMQEGYRIGDRVLRPSMVMVSQGGFKPVKAGASERGQAANDDPSPAGEGGNDDVA